MTQQLYLNGTRADVVRRPAAALWIASAFGTALILAAAVLAVSGTKPVGISRALQVTARFMFVPFWLAYAGGALTTLFGPAFQPIARRGRELGLAFASALLVHLSLIVWLCAVSERLPLPVKTFLFFGSAAACTYLLVLFSIKRLQQMLGPQLWRIIRTGAMEYIAFAFLTDFRHAGLHFSAKAILFYQVFLALIVLGFCLRLMSWIHRGASRPGSVLPLINNS